jgi:hypothetical protein
MQACGWESRSTDLDHTKPFRPEFAFFRIVYSDHQTLNEAPYVIELKISCPFLIFFVALSEAFPRLKSLAI